MKKKKLLITGLLSLSLFQVFAQASHKDTIAIDEITVTASKTPQPTGNVTQKIDVIGDKEFGKMVSGNRNISEVLMYLPGASISPLSRNDANWGTYGGIGAKYSTYMLQGLPIDAFVDPMSLDLSAIERIEVQRGPASVIYPNYLSQDFAGHQSPLTGTINLILKERIDQASTSFTTAYGSYNTLNGQFYHQGKTHNLHYYTGANFERSDYTDYGTENSWLNMQKNPEYQKTKLFIGATWYPADSDKQKFTLFVNKTFHTGDAGRIYRGFDNAYGTINTGYSIEINTHMKFQANMGIRSYNRSWQESNFGIIDTLQSNNGVDQTIVPVDISLSVKHGKNNLLIIGSDYQGADYSTWLDPLQGYQQYANKSRAWQSGFYAQEELRINRLTWRAGLRYNFMKNNIDLVDGGAPGEKSKEWGRLLWGTGLKYTFEGGVSFFANAGNSFLTPGLKSSGGTIRLSDRGVVGRHGQLPNPHLKPESGLGMDVGSDFSMPGNVKISIRGFYLAVTDAIIDNVVSQNPSQTQSVNAGKTTSKGFEAEVKQKLTTNLQWFTNYTLMKTEVKEAGTVPFAPEHVANLGLSLSTTYGLGLNCYLSYNHGFFDSSNKTVRQFFQPGTLINMNLSQVLAETENHRVEAFGNISNLTNNQYEMPWQFQNPGFSMMAGIKATF